MGRTEFTVFVVSVRAERAAGSSGAGIRGGSWLETEHMKRVKAQKEREPTAPGGMVVL